MKFLQIVNMLKDKEENKKAILLVKCGAFFVGVGEDAVLLNDILKLKTTCITNRVCKVGIPIDSIYEYIEKLEKIGYSFVIYNYSKDTFLENNKKYEEVYRYKGKEIDYIYLEAECEECDYYKKHKGFDNVNLFETLKKMQKEKENLKNEQ